MTFALSFDPELVGPWVCQRTGGTWTKGRGTAIGKINNGNLVAGALYEDWSGTNLVCHIAGDGKWADRRFLSIIFDYPFNQLGAKRITAPVCSSNHKGIALVSKMGFNIEAKLLGATAKGDLLLFSLFKDKCKFLQGKYG
jgi:hypothetical protein